MWKQNKWKIMISSLITLLPMVFGIIFWKELPEQMSTHWGIDGAVDGKSSAAFAVFGLPLILLVLNWLCLFLTSLDKKNSEQNPKVFGIIFWIIPVIFLLTNGLVYATAFGKQLDVLLLMPILFGLIFIFIGNYLPKCKQNYTMGIKVKWTLENEENWNATHRFAGKAWVLGGLLILFTALLPEDVMMIATFFLLFATAFIPMFYSYFYYRKQLKAGTYVENNTIPKSMNKTSKVITLLVLPLILIGVVVMMLVGTIALTYGESSFTVEATFSDSRTVEYDAVDSIEYREDFDKGTRIFGFSSARLLTGTFSNDEFGSYTLYSYTTCDSAVIIKVGNKTLAISGADNQSTKEIYDTLLSKCPGGSK